ncbi:MAG: hypothetical protein WD738_04685, partial [Pirellulales bacterium]
MTWKKQIRPDEKVGLKLTQAERTLCVEGLTLLSEQYEEAIRGAAANKPVMLTLDDLDELGGYVAADANHCEDRKGLVLPELPEQPRKIAMLLPQCNLAWFGAKRLEAERRRERHYLQQNNIQLPIRPHAGPN